MILTCPDDGGLAKDEGGGGDGDRSSARSQQHQSYNKPEIMYNTRLLTHHRCGDGDHSSARSQQHQTYNKPEIMYNTRLLTYDQRSCITIDC